MIKKIEKISISEKASHLLAMRISFLLFCLLNSTFGLAQVSDSIYYIDFKVKSKHLDEGGYKIENDKLKSEFTLQEKELSKYSIEILSDSNSVLSKFNDGKWQVFDTIWHGFLQTDTNEILVPSYWVMDFNKDGYQDFMCWVMTNMNGNRWTQIYLYNPNKNRIEKLNNDAEESDTWAAPEYNEKDSTIHCTEVSGNYGSSYESEYKLEYFIARPLKKVEIDNMSKNYKGKGGVKRIYKGENGKWVVVKISKIRK